MIRRALFDLFDGLIHRSGLVAALAVAALAMVGHTVGLSGQGGTGQGGSTDPPPHAQAPAEQPKSQVFRAGVDIVSLNVTVVDGQNHYVTDLTENEFSVFEDGAKQELSFFNRTNLPIALSLLMTRAPAWSSGWPPRRRRPSASHRS